MVGENGPSSSSDMHQTAWASTQPASSAALQSASSAGEAVSHDRLASEDSRLMRRLDTPGNGRHGFRPAANVTRQRLRSGEEAAAGPAGPFNPGFTIVARAAACHRLEFL